MCKDFETVQTEMDHLKSEFRDFQEDAQNKLQQLEAAKELAIREKGEEEQRAKLEKAQLEKEKLEELQAQREAADREKEEQIDILIRKSKEALKKAKEEQEEKNKQEQRVLEAEFEKKRLEDIEAVRSAANM